MRKNSKSNLGNIDKFDSSEARRLLARLRQDQLEAALAGRMDESAFFAGEARAFRLELVQADDASGHSCAACS